MNSYFIPLFPKSELHLESNDFFFLWWFGVFYWDPIWVIEMDIGYNGYYDFRYPNTNSLFPEWNR